MEIGPGYLLALDIILAFTIDARAGSGKADCSYSRGIPWDAYLVAFGETFLCSRLFLALNILIRCLELDATTKRWDCVSELPFRFMSLAFRSKAVVYNDYVWHFNGSKTLLRFHLVTGNWDTVDTKCNGWPYIQGLLQSFCIELLNDKLYIYGGCKGRFEILDAFMVLDLSRLKWRQLKMTDLVCPSAREAMASWVVPEENKLYIMFGSNTDSLQDLDSGSDMEFETESEYDLVSIKQIFDEMWSYSINDGRWKQEVIRGNPPSCREFMSAVYHPGLKSVISFGGSSDVPRLDDEFAGKQIHYADTFIMDVKALCWRQIVTRRFPMWRGCGELLVDDVTGEIYMFGGTYNSTFLKL